MKSTDEIVKNILDTAEFLHIRENDRYLVSYDHLRNRISNMPFDDASDLYIASLMVYGWMPTIPTFNSEKEVVDGAMATLLKLKHAKATVPTKDDIEAISKFLNNSNVGTSKLMHFIDSETYPIWDSKIQKAISGMSYHYIMKETDNYLIYCKLIAQLITLPELVSPIEMIKSIIKELFKYDISSVRAVEYLLFNSKF
jgi:hypothetical protein